MQQRWLTRRTVLATTAVAVWSPGCVLAGWWQATVAMSGNTLSYLYAVEWPVFALFGLVAWWWYVHADPETIGARGVARLRAAARTSDAAARGSAIAGVGSAETRATSGSGGCLAGPAPGGAGDDERSSADAAASDGLGDDGLGDDEEARAYNAYLASLRDRPKTWARR